MPPYGFNSLVFLTHVSPSTSTTWAQPLPSHPAAPLQQESDSASGPPLLDPHFCQNTGMEEAITGLEVLQQSPLGQPARSSYHCLSTADAPQQEIQKYPFR